MKKINVVISLDLPITSLEKIKNLSSNIIVNCSSDEKELLSLIQDADVLLAGKFSKKMLLAAKNLKWIQTAGVGVDRFLFRELVESKISLTNTGNIFSTAISEHVIMFMLIFSRKMTLFYSNQLKKQWNRLGGYSVGNLEELKGKTIGIIGFGNVGHELAKKAKCLGMEVIALKKRKSKKPDYVDYLLSIDKLEILLNKSDYVVLTLPLTVKTQNLICEGQFKEMKKNAYLINVSRGKIVNEKNLIEALERGMIAGAALDTFEEEPLHTNSKLWTMQNVVITPHVAGISSSYMERMVNIFCKNLLLYLSNKPLTNIVNKKEGY